MAAGRLETDWDRTAELCYLIAESNRDPRRRSTPYRPQDFHPFHVDDPRPAPPTIPYNETAAAIALTGAAPDGQPK
jgi:hypothetical protein